MTAPKVLANTSIFDEVQLDNSFDATVYSSAAGDNASNSSLDESYSPSIPDAGAQVEAPNGAQIAGLFQSVSLSGAQHDLSVYLGNDADLSSVILAPLAFSTESHSSVAESAATDAGNIVGALELSAISPNLVPHSDFSTFAISPSGELTDAADASISGGLRGLVAGAETGSAGPFKFPRIGARQQFRLCTCFTGFGFARIGLRSSNREPVGVPSACPSTCRGRSGRSTYDITPRNCGGWRSRRIFRYPRPHQFIGVRRIWRRITTSCVGRAVVRIGYQYHLGLERQ